MKSASTRTLYLERPCFWTEPRDPEVWFRALEAIMLASHTKPQTGTPRTVAERCLIGIIAWRGAVGLFGVWDDDGRLVLPGVDLVRRNAIGHWYVTTEGQELVRLWRQNADEGLSQLAAHLVRESPWLRLFLLRIVNGDWHIDRVLTRGSRVEPVDDGATPSDRCTTASDWFAGVEEKAVGRWLARTGCVNLAFLPILASRKRGKDDLSLAPLAAPLRLLETLGWLTSQGVLRLPSALQSDLVGGLSAAALLADISARRADLRGLVAAEPSLRELLAFYGASPDDGMFSRWMDQLVEISVTTGALEILAAEPGQTRHGRGLFGDPARKLVRWMVHLEFNDRFHSAWAALGSSGSAPHQSPAVRGEERTQ